MMSCMVHAYHVQYGVCHTNWIAVCVCVCVCVCVPTPLCAHFILCIELRFKVCATNLRMVQIHTLRLRYILYMNVAL